MKPALTPSSADEATHTPRPTPTEPFNSTAWLGSFATQLDSISKPLRNSMGTITRTVSESLYQASHYSSPSRDESLPEEGPHQIPSLSAKSDLKAPGEAPVGFSFSPAGLLLPYHLGVIDYLQHTGWLTEHVPIGGASAGAIAVVCAALKIEITELMPVLYEMEANLREKGTAQRLKKQLQLRLNSVIPEDAHLKLGERPRPAYVVYTNVMPWKGMKVHEFLSKEDLIDCVLASCNIPLYFHKTPTIKCRAAASIDGYFADRRNFGCPPMPNVKHQVRVLPFCANDVLGHLSPDEFIAPDLSQFDEEISDLDYQEFIKYMAAYPAPQSDGQRRSSQTKPPIPQGPPADSAEEFHEAIRVEGHVEPSTPKGHDMPRTVPQLRGRQTDGGRRSRSVGDCGTRNCFSRKLPHSQSPREEEQEIKEVKSVVVENDTEWRFWGFSKKTFLSSFLHSITPSSEPRSSLSPTQITSYSGVSSGKGGKAKTGRRHVHLPLSRFSWRTLLHYALNPTEEDATVRELFDLGRADAFRWVQLQARRGVNSVPSANSP